MTARDQAELHIFGEIVGKEIGDALIDGDVRRLTKTIQSAILAEREACAKICEDGQNCRTCGDFFIGDRSHECEWSSWDMPSVNEVALAIRARSDPPEEKPMPSQCSYKFAFGGYQCVLWDGHFTRHKTRIHDGTEIEVENLPNLTPFDPECSTDRIATLHEWQATDAKIIQQLNQSNNLLSEKITQLEKEKNELTQKTGYCVLCRCDGCTARLERERPASRKT